MDARSPPKAALLQTAVLRWAHVALTTTLLALAAVPPAHALDTRIHDHDEALALVEAGTIRPLSEILAGLADRVEGRIIEVTLEADLQRWVYELTFLNPVGHLVEVEVDAVSGVLLEAE